MKISTFHSSFLAFILPFFCLAQVGIGTDLPQADLHVAGSTLVQDEFSLGTLPIVNSTDEDFKLLTRITNTTPQGRIAVLDVDELKVAPINVINYKFNNLSLDNLKDVDLQFDANKYVVGIANFRYVGDAIQKQLINGKQSVGAFVMRTFTNNGTWHLEIRNRFLDLDAGQSIKYFVTLIVYDNSYYRKLPTITTDLGGSNTGTASETPTLNN